MELAIGAKRMVEKVRGGNKHDGRPDSLMSLARTGRGMQYLHTCAGPLKSDHDAVSHWL